MMLQVTSSTSAAIYIVDRAARLDTSAHISSSSDLSVTAVYIGQVTAFATEKYTGKKWPPNFEWHFRRFHTSIINIYIDYWSSILRGDCIVCILRYNKVMAHHNKLSIGHVLLRFSLSEQWRVLVKDKHSGRYIRRYTDNHNFYKLKSLFMRSIYVYTGCMCLISEEIAEYKKQLYIKDFVRSM
jgi:hypothetical protein